MKIIDISWPIDEHMTVQKEIQPVLFEPTKTFVKDKVRESHIHLNAHTGTHIDAPSYLFRDGKTVDQIDLYTCIGPANVLDLTNVDGSIKEEHLHAHEIHAGDIILLKTKNSSKDPTTPYDPNFVYLDHSAANYLVKQKVKTVGFDYITLEPKREFDRAHRELLEHEITVIEGLRLFFATPGLYFLFCLPLYVLGIEAAPTRAVLLDIREELEIETEDE
ncbi:cyclase family protein [Candidatus Dependentiae bacterium]|nr:MAG: cyclase family protein [Candidatus Dependentiae bacterium]